MTETTQLDIAADHPAYAGHFPGAPILPGVVLLDAALHSVSRLRGSVSARWQVVSAKFHSVVQPGEALTLEHEALPNGTVRFAIRATRDDVTRPVASGVLKSSIAADGQDDGERTR